MSFEDEKARMIKELADAQAEIKATFKMAPRREPAKPAKDTKPTGPQRTPSSNS